jgi:tetratricopeptide (TPR) repeat protein
MAGGSRSLAALLATLLVAGPALAQRKAPTEKDKQFAGELVKRAIARSQAGDHDAAIAIYQQAYATVASSALLSNIGSEYQQVGKPKEALKYFCMYLDKDPVGSNAAYATAQARLLQSQITNRAVDDAELCVATPRPQPKEPIARPAQAPTRPIAIEPPPEPPAEPPHGNAKLKYTGLAIGAAGAVVTSLGLYYGAQALSISNEITNHDAMTGCDHVRDRQAAGQHAEDLQIGLLIAGGVLLTTGVVLYVLGRSSAAPERAADKAAVRVVPTSRGVAVLGRF